MRAGDRFTGHDLENKRYEPTTANQLSLELGRNLSSGELPPAGMAKTAYEVGAPRQAHEWADPTDMSRQAKKLGERSVGMGH